MSAKKELLPRICLCYFSTFVFWTASVVHAAETRVPTKEEKTAASESENEIAEFDPSLLRQDGQNQIDVSRFIYGSNVLPGKYRVEILVNQTMMANQEVAFKSSEQHKNKVEPCLTPNVINLIKLDSEKLPFAVRKALTEPAECTDLSALISGATVKFDADQQQLNIEVPQLYLRQTARGNIDPALWDSGVPALMLGYYMNGYESHYSGAETSRTFYSSFNAGLNIGKWYFRHNGSYNWDQDIGGNYQSNNTYVQRDIEAVRGHLYLGQYYTTGQMFNTVSFTGAQLATDDRMLPASQRGYAPEIRGIAKTNAKVTVRQSGNILYQATVPPGAFLINDLGQTGYGGDLDVTVEEADGTSQQYSIPYSSLAQSLRPGAQQFGATVGKLRDYSSSEEPLFSEVTYMRGITNILTAYTGAQVSQNYQAVLVGGAVGTRLGAISADVTQAWSHLGGEKGNLVGQSYRASYSKLIDATNSNISIAAYRYSSSGYMDLQTAVQTRDTINHDGNPDSIWRSKNQFSIRLNQGLPRGLGNVYISSSLQNYWNSNKGYNTQYQIGYSNSYKWLNYSINATRNKSETGQDQTSWYLTISMPLWPGHSGSVPYMSMRYNEDSDGGQGEQVNLSGSFGQTNQYSYNISGSHDNYSGSSGNVSGSWANSKATLNGSYSTGSGYNSTSVGMSGGLVVHSGGITFSPYNSDSYALIEAKGAEGAEVAGYGGAAVDSSGYALSPSLIPYQQNHVAINPEGSDLGVEFENTSQEVVPRAGSVVKVKFNTHTGTPLLIVSTWKGEPLPFGADIVDDENTPMGAVSQGGVIYVKVSKPKGVLIVKWGEDDRSQCQVTYMLDNADPDKDSLNTIQRFTQICQ